MKSEHVIEISGLDTHTLACSEQDICNSLDAVLANLNIASVIHEVHIQLLSAAEIMDLNTNHRGHDKPTNVLSFPQTRLKGVSPVFIGDIVLCPEIVASEAEAQHKTVYEHSVHLIVHSLLHLFYYDHENAAEANIMESKEIAILSQLGLPNPYKEV